jgi:CBS domain-containing protein
MKLSDLGPKPPVSVACDASIEAAARLMDTANVGALVVMDGDRLAGIVTDRDITVRAVGRGVPSDGRIDSVMTTDVVTAPADADVHGAYELLRSHAIRRLPLTAGGRLVGLVSVDDLLVGLAADLANLARPVTGELLFGHHPAPVPSTT